MRTQASKYTPEFKAALVADYVEGEPIAGFAKVHGVSSCTARNWLLKAGKQVPTLRTPDMLPTEEEDRHIKAQLDDGIPLKEIARESRHPYSRLRDLYPNAVWTEEDGLAFGTETNKLRKEAMNTRLGNRFPKVPQEKLDRATKMIEDGASKIDIMETVGLSHNSMTKYFPDFRGWTYKEAGQQANRVRKLNLVGAERKPNEMPKSKVAAIARMVEAGEPIATIKRELKTSHYAIKKHFPEYTGVSHREANALGYEKRWGSKV